MIIIIILIWLDFSTSVEMTLSLVSYKQYMVTSTNAERSNPFNSLRFLHFGRNDIAYVEEIVA